MKVDAPDRDPTDFEPVAEIDLGALARNLARVRARLARRTRVLAAVKADAYGHGAALVAPSLQAAGADAFGVATPAEALALRAAGVTAPILVFTPVHGGIEELVAHDVALTVPDEAALSAVEAARAGRARVHVKVDTGMGRLGTRAEDARPLLRRVARSPYAVLEGLATHFACADDPGAAGAGSHARTQLERFERLVDDLEREGLRPPLVHAANSAATFALPEAHFDMVRPGIALYGHHPSPARRAPDLGLEPVMTLSAAITSVKPLRRGDTVSYGASWRAERDTLVATVRLGYADGYRRDLGGRASVRLAGTDVRVVGRVCMDQLMLDVGHLAEGAADGGLGADLVGARVVAFGRGGPDAADLAERIGTIPYELLTSVAARVPRRYVDRPGSPAR